MTTKGSEVTAWVKADTRDSKDIPCGWKPWVTLPEATNCLCRRSTLITSTNCRKKVSPLYIGPQAKMNKLCLPTKHQQALFMHHQALFMHQQPLLVPTNFVCCATTPVQI
jgi:hypothetical protein